MVQHFKEKYNEAQNKNLNRIWIMYSYKDKLSTEYKTS